MHERNIADDIGTSALQKGPVGGGVFNEAKEIATLAFQDVGKEVFATGNHTSTVLGQFPHLIGNGGDLDLGRK